jgi:hypothetical protein
MVVGVGAADGVPAGEPAGDRDGDGAAVGDGADQASSAHRDFTAADVSSGALSPARGDLVGFLSTGAGEPTATGAVSRFRRETSDRAFER